MDATLVVIGAELRQPFLQVDGVPEQQELLLHEEAGGDHRSCATGSQELGNGGQQMCQEDGQVLPGQIG